MRTKQRETEVLWTTAEDAASIAPGLSVSKLHAVEPSLTRSGADVRNAVRVLSDGERIYDELLLRRWLEGTVAGEWVHGPAPGYRVQAAPDRLYAYQDAPLETLRARTYVDESRLCELLPEVPLWRIRDLRIKGFGPRFLKPTPMTVVYIEEEALAWALGVGDFSDNAVDEHGLRVPFTPSAPTIESAGSPSPTANVTPRWTDAGPPRI